MATPTDELEALLVMQATLDSGVVDMTDLMAALPFAIDALQERVNGCNVSTPAPPVTE